MKALVVGYGSIGKRHAGNLLKLKQIDQVIVCSSHHDSLQNHAEKEKLKLVRSLGELPFVTGNGERLDLAIVANETYKHLETAEILAKAGINLLIEKPVSESATKAAFFKKEVENTKIKVFVAYNFRFLGAIQYIKNLIDSGVIGRLFFAEISVGQYLPSWRPAHDYQKSYSAHKEQGGGAALDMSHEIDYMRYLFGDPVAWKIMKAKVSDLNIDSEDIFMGVYRFSTGFLCNVHTDYIRSHKKRGMNIVGSKGTLECDFMDKYIKVQKDSGEVSLIEDGYLFDVDETYRSELNHFIECIAKDITPRITLSDGIEVLKLIEGDHV